MRTLFPLLVLTLATGVVLADFEAGMAAYRRGDFDAAIAIWRPLAAEGDARAQNALGVLHSMGQGLPRSDEQALAWYRKAAKGGYPNAMYNVAGVYREGRGVEIDYDEAIVWMRRSAELGYRSAQFDLGRMYAGGEGTEADLVEAYKWMLLANIALREQQNVLEGIRGLLTDAQREEAEKRARAWEPRQPQPPKLR